MDEKQAKNLIEALIFSAEEPLSIESIRKILSTYGKFDLEKLINDLENHNSIKNTEADENNSRVLEISTR